MNHYQFGDIEDENAYYAAVSGVYEQESFYSLYQERQREFEHSFMQQESDNE